MTKVEQWRTPGVDAVRRRVRTNADVSSRGVLATRLPARKRTVMADERMLRTEQLVGAEALVVPTEVRPSVVPGMGDIRSGCHELNNSELPCMHQARSWFDSCIETPTCARESAYQPIRKSAQFSGQTGPRQSVAAKSTRLFSDRSTGTL